MERIQVCNLILEYSDSYLISSDSLEGSDLVISNINNFILNRDYSHPFTSSHVRNARLQIVLNRLSSDNVNDELLSARVSRVKAHKRFKYK